MEDARCYGVEMISNSSYRSTFDLGKLTFVSSIASIDTSNSMCQDFHLDTLWIDAKTAALIASDVNSFQTSHLLYSRWNCYCSTKLIARHNFLFLHGDPLSIKQRLLYSPTRRKQQIKQAKGGAYLSGNRIQDGRLKGMLEWPQKFIAIPVLTYVNRLYGP